MTNNIRVPVMSSLKYRKAKEKYDLVRKPICYSVCVGSAVY